MKTEAVETKSRNQGNTVAKAVGGILLALCLIASLVLNICQAVQASAQNEKVNSFIQGQLERQAKEEEQENSYIEDGFVVGDNYEIRSTTHISDAYKSGDDSQLSEADRDTLKMAEAVLDEVIEDGMDNYEKELAVYTWMVENIGGSGSEGVISRPGGSTDAYTPHDVLTSKSAVCVGYATTFRLLMNMLDMDVHIVHNEYHSWDLVELEEGQWYHVDIYSDAHGAMFGNFNMTDAVCQTGHTWDGSALPVADSVEYSPAVRFSEELDGLMDVPARLKQDLDGGKSAVFYRFKTPLTEEEMGTAEFLVNLLDYAVTAMPDGDYYYFRACWYPGENDENILGLMVEREDGSGIDTPSIDAGTPEGRAIIQAIAEAFGIDPSELGDVDIDDEGEDQPVDIDEFTGSGSVVVG